MVMYLASGTIKIDELLYYLVLVPCSTAFFMCLQQLAFTLIFCINHSSFTIFLNDCLIYTNCKLNQLIYFKIDNKFPYSIKILNLLIVYLVQLLHIIAFDSRVLYCTENRFLRINTLLYSQSIDTTNFKPNYIFFYSYLYFIIFSCRVEVQWKVTLL